MVLKKLVPGNIPGIHAGDRVVHEQLCIELGNAGGRRNGSEGLTKIVPPLGERFSVLLCFRYMPGLAVRGE